MTSIVKTVRVPCNTSTGTQTITVPNLGTPKAAMFIITRGVTDATLADNAIIGVGFTDGTTHRAFTAKNEDNVAANDVDCRGVFDEVILINDLGTAIDGEANFDSFIKDGIIINWGNAPVAAYLLTVIFFAGDISVDVNDITTNGTINLTTSTTSPGFEPDIIIFGGNGFVAFNDTNSGAYIPQVGFASNETSIVQGLLANINGDGGGTSSPSVAHSNQYCFASYFVSGGYANAAELTSFDANGFTITTREDTVVNGISAFLAIKFNDNTKFALDFIDSGVSAADQDITALSFKPQAVIQLVSFIDTEESQDTTGAEASSMGISVFDGTNEFCSMISAEDNVTTMNTKSISTAKAIKVIDNAGTTTHEATFVSFLPNGWRLNYSIANATARKWIALSIEDSFVPRMMTY